MVFSIVYLFMREVHPITTPAILRKGEVPPGAKSNFSNLCKYMDTIIFENGDKYVVNSVDMSFDEDGKPADIVLTSNSEELLAEIADKHCHIGCNIQYEDHGVFAGLYARLDKFSFLKQGRR
jgi:hypothetical protein